jgi:hypothetical protein
MFQTLSEIGKDHIFADYLQFCKEQEDKIYLPSDLDVNYIQIIVGFSYQGLLQSQTETFR